MENTNIIIYQTEDGNTKIETRLENETVWLNQAQLAELFQKSRVTITEPIRNIFKEGELIENSVCRNFRHTAADGKEYNTTFDAQKPNLGLTSFKGKKPTKQETEIAKNYLNGEELNILNRMVTAYLELAELQALNRKPMYINDWIERLDDFVKMTGNTILQNAGSVSH